MSDGDLEAVDLAYEEVKDHREFAKSESEKHKDGQDAPAPDQGGRAANPGEEGRPRRR